MHNEESRCLYQYFINIYKDETGKEIETCEAGINMKNCNPARCKSRIESFPCPICFGKLNWSSRRMDFICGYCKFAFNIKNLRSLRNSGRPIMIWCFEGFKREDPNSRGYSLEEHDIYGNIGFKFIINGEKNHRLSIRKNLTNNFFELYRFYYNDSSIEILFQSKNPQEILDRGNDQFNKYYPWNDKNETRFLDLICLHDKPQKSDFCMKGKFKVKEVN